MMIRIVGAGPGSAGYLTGEGGLVIKNSRVLVGGKRILDALSIPSERRVELPPDGMAAAVVKVLERESAEGEVTLVVSGDPGFYSLAKKVAERFGRENVSITPGISSIQILAARLCRSWVGAASMTIHGRARPDISELVARAVNAPALVVLFGAPEEVGGHIGWMSSRHELASARAAIGWDLGLPEERIFESQSLKELEDCPHIGRLALLWLETKKEEARDAGQ